MNPNRSFILCATDFSLPASAATTVAAKLARHRGEQLRLIHVTAEARRSARIVLRGRLEAETARLPQGGDVEPRLLLSLCPAGELLDYIRSERPSLVVLGGGAADPENRRGLGRFAERIAEGSPVPTLIVRDPAVFDEWDWRKARLSVMLALDFYPSSDVVLRWAKQFQMAGPCDLTACHVNWRVPTMGKTTGASGALMNPPAVQAQLERDLQKKVRDQLGSVSVPVIVRPYFGDPGPGLVEIAAANKVQLIAVGAHQRHGIHRLAQFSVSRDVLHRSGMNVVCVPVTAAFDAREAHLPDFQRVLVATDFSELGNTAIPFACTLCSGGLVRIVHVATSRVRSRSHPATDGSADLAERLRDLIPRETGAHCQPPEVAVLEDTDVAAAICAEAERFGADVVCLASHGLGVSRALHGSVTKTVLKRLRRPLLIVRRPEE